MVKHAPDRYSNHRPDYHFFDRPFPHRRHKLARCPYFPYRLRIGLMGGSFNPAHEGHIYIASIARKFANLDEVWWLVSPQNPLKSADETAPFATRLSASRALADKYKWLRCLDIEQVKALTRTVDSLNYMKRICPYADLFWIMGADNLVQFPQWADAKKIKGLMPMIIVNRPNWHYRALASAGAYLLGTRLRNVRHLTQHQQGWTFIHQGHSSLSSSKLRASSKRKGLPSSL